MLLVREVAGMWWENAGFRNGGNRRPSSHLFTALPHYSNSSISHVRRVCTCCKTLMAGWVNTDRALCGCDRVVRDVFTPRSTASMYTQTCLPHVRPLTFPAAYFVHIAFEASHKRPDGGVCFESWIDIVVCTILSILSSVIHFMYGCKTFLIG